MKMVTTRKRAVAADSPVSPKRRSKEDGELPRRPSPSPTTTRGGDDGATDEGYEKLREQRIRENLDRMQKLGIVDLSLLLNKSLQRPNPNPNPNLNPNPTSRPRRGSPLSDPSKHPTRPHRRSSRLLNVTPVSYSEIAVALNKVEGTVRKRSAYVEQGQKEEFYTDEHEKLLGTCQASWTLFVDGYGRDGRRVYDQTKGKTCHQCRQKTLGHRTRCCQCNLVQGQFCGDCLYMRYGENVLEVEKNPNWICPVCRGICNCSLCRLKKGWPPTGPLYKKVLSLGFKSVAHYLVQTRRHHINLGDENSTRSSTKKSLNFADAEDSKPENSVGPENGLKSVLYEKNSECNGTDGSQSGEEHSVNNALKNTQKLTNKSNKGKEPAAMVKRSRDSIGNRLRSRS